MMTRSKQRPTAAKRAKARARHSHTEPLPADRLFKIADAAESIADNLRALTLPNAEDWLRKSVRDWYETTGHELRSLGLLD